DAVAWVLDESLNVVASNDDGASGVSDSYLQTALPGTPQTLATYYVVFREAQLREATFVVTLHHASCYDPNAAGNDGPSICADGFHWNDQVCNCVETIACVPDRPCANGRSCVEGRCELVPPRPADSAPAVPDLGVAPAA